MAPSPFNRGPQRGSHAGVVNLPAHSIMISMKKVTGIGGIFFKAQDPEKLRAWYQQHLGIECNEHGAADFEWRETDEPHQMGRTVWSPFPRNTRYLDPGTQPFMINYRVANLDTLLN